MRENNEFRQVRRSANTTGIVAFALAACIFLLGSVLYVALYGVPGGPGGTSPQQQKSSGAPAPSPPATVGEGRTRETQGYFPPNRREGANAPLTQTGRPAGSDMNDSNVPPATAPRR
jgi:hypothetical protein